MTIKIFAENAKKLKYNMAKLYGVSNKGDLLILQGKNEPLFLKFEYPDEEGEGIRWHDKYFGSPLQDLASEVSREYWKRRTHDRYIVREDMIVRK